MANMTEDGDKTCPLCAEEMDLTDQQLKPCKCGYEICVWCWHHIMDMAEKDDTEGRCPACRTTYEKERIVATSVNCGRMVAEVKTGKKQKSQQAKSKTSVEARKHLNGVRVVQRNLVYIIGLPINLSDESLLERKEYFGQYGKVLKVSISRPTGATAHRASNSNTFGVYITYGREEEAVRCIQAVHNFVLEGTTLSACFGTTKYCHAWLRNMTCSNPDCLYLHDIGSQEESFTKDEIISVYTRSRVLQNASTNLQRRSGNVLPPPMDDFSTRVTSNKTIPMSTVNNSVSHAKASNYYAGKPSTDLAAAASWGSRASKCQSPVGSLKCSLTSTKQKGESADSSSVYSSAKLKQASHVHDEDVIASSISERNHEVQKDRLSRPPVPLKSCVSRVVSDTSSDNLQVEACVAGSSAWDDDIPIASGIPEERYTVQMNGARPVKPAESSDVREFLISGLDTSSTTTSDASSSVISTNCSSIHSASADGNNGNMVHMNGARPVEPARSNAVGDSKISGLDAESRMTSYASLSSLSSVSCSTVNFASAPGKETGVVFPRSNGNLVNGTHDILDRQCISSRPDEPPCNRTDDNGSIQSLCSGMSSLNTDGHLMVDHPGLNEHLGSTTNFSSAGMANNLASSFEQCTSENRFEDLSTVPCTLSPVLSTKHASRESSNWSSETQNQVLPSGNKISGPLSTDGDQTHIISHVRNGESYSSYLNYPLNVANFINSWDNDVSRDASSVDGDSRTITVGRDMFQLREDESTLFTEQKSLTNSCKTETVSELPEKNLNAEKVKSFARSNGEANFDRSTSSDVAERSIISDMLSPDFDPWAHSLSSANDFAKLLGRKNNEDSSLFSSSWNSSINQSRFSFARQENELNQSASFREHPDIHKSVSLLHNSYGDGHSNGNGFSSSKVPYVVNRDPVVSSGGHAGLSRAKISGPPGFSSMNKASPPGFSFQDKCEQTYAPAYSENIMHTSLGNQYQVRQSDTMADVEFIDPAILAVGRGHMPLGVNNSSMMGPSFPSQFIPKSDLELQLLMQQSASSHQSHRISDHIGDMLLPLNDPYDVPRLLPQSFSSRSPFAHPSLQQLRNSHTLSNHQGGWNDTQTINEVGIFDMLRNERSGLNNYYLGHEDYKYHVQNADLYNRSF